jgi:ABC-type transport system involved in cytochrome c biogenesis permease component
MKVLPIIHREMLIESRRPAYYTMRLLAGTAFTALLAFYAVVVAGGAVTVGAAVFQQLSFDIYIGIWLAAPFFTADCLSKEKREGTLGLLFLTPLTALGIVVGKSLVHGLRALSFLFAATPILAVPYLMGGVSWKAILAVLAAQVTALALALGAGLLGSAGARQWRWAFVQTALWTLLLAFLHFYFVRLTFVGGAPVPIGALLAVGVLIPGLIVIIAASRVRAEWQDKPLSKRQLWWLRTFCSPVFWRDLFRASMRRELDRNPIAWLQYYSTWDRVAKLVWCGLALMLAAHLVIDFRGSRDSLGLELLFAFALAYTAASSFRRERRNGAFELILVSPIARTDIISGRLKAVRAQFFPAALALFLPWPWMASMIGNNQMETFALLQCAFIWTTYWSLPIIGLYFALGSRSFFRAFLSTCFVGIVFPFLLAQVVVFLISSRAGFEDGCRFALFYQVGVIVLFSLTLPQQFDRLATQPSRS